MKTTFVALAAALGLCVTAIAEDPKTPPQPSEPPTTAPAAAKGEPTTTAPAKAETGKPKPGNASVLTKFGPKPRVEVKTTLGSFTLELDAEKAPITVENFLGYVEAGYYEGTVFHRVIPNFMVQAGGFLPNLDKKTEGVKEPIKLESGNGLKNVRGTIAMARTSRPESATTQFFINVVDNDTKLDYPRPDGHGYAVFGAVVEGMDTVDAIRDTPTATNTKYRGGPVVPVTAVVIESVCVVATEDASKTPTTQPATTQPATTQPADAD